MHLKFISIVLLVLLVVSNVWWLVGSLDAGLAGTQQKETFDNQSENVRNLKEILLRCAAGRSRNEIADYVKGIDADASIGVDSETSMFVNYLEFRFEGDRLVSIEHSY